jgi:hypothetical protein
MPSRQRHPHQLAAWRRGLGWLIPRALAGLLYAAALTGVLVGAVMLGDWHALARRR